MQALLISLDVFLLDLPYTLVHLQQFFFFFAWVSSTALCVEKAVSFVKSDQHQF